VRSRLGEVARNRGRRNRRPRNRSQFEGPSQVPLFSTGWIERDVDNEPWERRRREALVMAAGIVAAFFDFCLIGLLASKSFRCWPGAFCACADRLFGLALPAPSPAKPASDSR